MGQQHCGCGHQLAVVTPIPGMPYLPLEGASEPRKSPSLDILKLVGSLFPPCRRKGQPKPRAHGSCLEAVPGGRCPWPGCSVQAGQWPPPRRPTGWKVSLGGHF